MIPFVGTILSSLFRKYSTVEYPAKPMPDKPSVRGRIECDVDRCIFCGICQRKCPTGAITVTRGEKTWEIQRLACIQCGNCVEPCPKKCLALSSTAPNSAPGKDLGIVTMIQQPPAAPTTEAGNA